MVINLNFSELIDVAYIFTNKNNVDYSHDIYIVPEEGEEFVNYFVINKVSCENKVDLKKYVSSKDFLLEGIYIKQLNFKNDIRLELTNFLINLNYNDSDKEELLRSMYKELIPIHKDLRKIFYLTPSNEDTDTNIYSFERRYVFSKNKKVLVEDIGFFNINKILNKYKEVVFGEW